MQTSYLEAPQCSQTTSNIYWHSLGCCPLPDLTVEGKLLQLHRAVGLEGQPLRVRYRPVRHDAHESETDTSDVTPGKLAYKNHCVGMRCYLLLVSRIMVQSRLLPSNVDYHHLLSKGSKQFKNRKPSYYVRSSTNCGAAVCLSNLLGTVILCRKLFLPLRINVSGTLDSRAHESNHKIIISVRPGNDFR